MRKVKFDIHMVFAEQKPSPKVGDAQVEALECASITAEVIPRRRSEESDSLGRLKKMKKSDTRLARSPEIIARDVHRPLRLTGAVVFGQFAPSGELQNTAAVSGMRVVLEIHPVYAVDLCTFKSLAACKWNNERLWTLLDVFVSDEDQDDQ